MPAAHDEDKIDSAALAAAALAAVLAISGEEGEYDLLNFATGISVLGILLAYEGKKVRDHAKSVALGFVIGLASTLPIGFIVQMVFRSAFKKNEQIWTAFAVWLVVTIAFYFFDRHFLQRKRA